MNTIKNTLVENLATQGQEKLSINGIKDKYIRENMKKLIGQEILVLVDEFDSETGNYVAHSNFMF